MFRLAVVFEDGAGYRFEQGQNIERGFADSRAV